KAAIRELLALVGRRLDLLADLKKLGAEYRRDRKDRPASELKRLEQLAADRQSDDGATLDVLLAIDSSRSAKTLEELLEAYYHELVELGDRGVNLKDQKEKGEELAADGQSDGGATLDVVLAIDSSRSAKTLEELLEAYYHELVELEDRGVNLKDQKEKVE